MSQQIRWRVGAAWLTLVFCLLGSSLAQEKANPPRKVVIMPRDVVLPVIASQPESPLRFEGVEVVTEPDGNGQGGHEVFRLRNVGQKPIRSFIVASLTSAGTGGRWEFTAPSQREWIMPGDIDLESKRERPLSRVPVTDELRERLKLRGPLQGIIVLMVVRVETADGSVFDDEPAYKALRDYLEKHAN
jgi:hypothetical protein